TPPAELQRLVEVNLTGTMLGSAAAAPWLIEAADRGAPRGVSSPRSGIINTASIFAPLAPPGFAAYSATKAGVVAFSRALRGELATSQLNVTVTLPGVVSTRLFGSARFATPAFKAAAERFVQQTELSPESVAEQTLRAAHRGLAEAVLGRRAGRFASLRRWAPALADYLVQRRATRELGLAAQRSADDPPNNASPVTAADQPTVARSQAHGKTCST
ncbi:MAG: SDR family NAD(P)-dependent oxidoreductase, partial [Planctomycetota bacterium]